jgi:hypothetical protein
VRRIGENARFVGLATEKRHLFKEQTSFEALCKDTAASYIGFTCREMAVAHPEKVD